jgi:macrodomain Ter protein organizer (MatP/YcbG family)
MIISRAIFLNPIKLYGWINNHLSVLQAIQKSPTSRNLHQGEDNMVISRAIFLNPIKLYGWINNHLSVLQAIQKSPTSRNLHQGEENDLEL